MNTQHDMLGKALPLRLQQFIPRQKNDKDGKYTNTSPLTSFFEESNRNVVLVCGALVLKGVF